MEPLDLTKIIANIDPRYNKYIAQENFKIFTQIHSTNSYLLECAKVPDNKLIFCVADLQTTGRGRLNRQWNSPAGNIYLSILWNFDLKINKIAGLHIAIAVAVILALNNYGATGLKLKWPNDILYQEAKLAGILIENIVKPETTTAVIGIGINLLPPVRSNEDLIPNKMQNLQSIIQKTPDRNLLIGKLLSEILDKLITFEKYGLDQQLITAWQNQSYNLNELVTLKTATKIIQGINRGIDHQGNLLLEIHHNDPKKDHFITLKTISSGEITVSNSPSQG